MPVWYVSWQELWFPKINSVSASSHLRDAQWQSIDNEIPFELGEIKRNTGQHYENN